MVSVKFLSALTVGVIILGSAASALAHDGYYDRGRGYGPPSRVVIVQPGRTIIAPYPPPYGVVYERPRWHRHHREQFIFEQTYHNYVPAWGYAGGRHNLERYQR